MGLFSTQGWQGCARAAAEADLDGLQLLAPVLLGQHIDGVLVLLPGGVKLRLRFAQLFGLQQPQRLIIRCFSSTGECHHEDAQTLQCSMKARPLADDCRPQLICELHEHGTIDRTDQPTKQQSCPAKMHTAM